ncbi:maltokinase N-terminal cap-like domain-containing protein [Thermobifida cellulosilytica]|uniref:Maltokinase n=1 Tax=Thermobifida cellulosilytica TB100 TaxID=665004 RepID=A0A147KJJ6_THECS|nr:phosphotransferase [Thermobifida cellulosilytica]KUP97421.1 hypothetical protein AC529_07000 [Thermobifida cellulosilytica TB100]
MNTPAAPSVPPARFETALAAWLPWQRWFSAKERRLSEVTVVRCTEFASAGADGPVGLVLVVRADFADGGAPEHYQVPVGLCTRIRRRLEPAVIAGAGEVVVYDALQDPALVSSLLRLVDTGAVRGDLVFGRTDPDRGLRVQVQTSRPLNAEQSNSSVIVDERYLLKVFRRLQAGLNPDLELQEALTRAGSTRVPRSLGSVHGGYGGARTTYATLQEYLPGAASGWSMALASVRDLVAGGEEPGAAGGDFAAEARRLGRAVAEVHAELADSLGSTPLTREDMARLSQAMLRQLDSAVGLVPGLAAVAERLRTVFAAVAGLPGGHPGQRIHGDLHLGQTIRTPGGWLLVDFEGEPAAPLEQRRAFQSPLRDVAGMLRSFDYAAHHQFYEPVRPFWFDPEARIRAGKWASRNQDAFCEGYASVAGRDPRQDPVLLRAYTAHKAVYEVLYEVRNRPGWLDIPLRALHEMAREALPA